MNSMNLKSIFATLALFTAVLGGAATAAAADIKFEAQLIWGTSAAKPDDSKLKAADAEVRKKLASLPLKWTHYYEVNRQSLTVAASATKKSALSDRCTVEVKHLGGDKIEVLLLGQGKEVGKVTQQLPRGEILVLAGNAPAENAWLVTLKRIE
jgi:hypothetical protein